MNAKEISIKNIEEYGYKVGKSIRGKGTEVLRKDFQILSTWTTYIKRMDIDYINKTISKYPIEKLYIETISYNNDRTKHYSDAESSRKEVDIKKLIESKFKNVESFSVRHEGGSLIGYISLNKYKSDLESQQELILDLMRLEGKTIYQDDFISEEVDSLEYEEDVISFKLYRDDEYWNGDYRLVHGNNYYVEDTGECEFVNGKISNYNDSVLDDFWNYEFDEGLIPYLKEVEPDDKIAVYTRKGKDWYIGYAYDEEEVTIYYLDEDGDEEEDVFYIPYCEPDDELFEKIVDIVKSTKEDLECRGYIYNQIEEDSKKLELMYEDLNDFRDEVYDLIPSEKWTEKDITEAYQKAYMKIEDERVKVTDDLTVKITYSYCQICTESKPDEVYEYNHLKLLQKYGKKLGFEVVKSSISLTDENLAWAIRKDGEEYHFDLLEVISEVEDPENEMKLRDLVEEAFQAIEKRKLEKLSHKELMEKASHVFVGIEDSLSSGNCKTGTYSFIQRHKIDTSKIGGIRGDVLLDMEMSVFTQRAVNQAILNHLNNK